MKTLMKRLSHPSRCVVLVSCLAVSAVLITILVGVRARAQSQNGEENRKKPSSASVAQPPADQPPKVDGITPNGVPPGCTEGIVDGGFETGGIPNTFWDPETSTNFGTPLCNAPSCGTGGGTAPPRTGDFWAWFGGIPAPETATLGQTVTIPVNSSATLNFWLRIGAVNAPFTDVLNVRVDGVIQQSFPEPAVAEGAYTLRTINLNAFANGASHQILFEYIGPSSGNANFTVDDVSLEICPLTPAPVIVAAGATITAESCSPADNALSPGETVTVNFGLKNNGGASTTNLVATLQATGGVTSPSGPQNYGAIPPDNTTVVTRPFTFTVDPTKVCGDTVTATLQLQDGANNLGTVSFTLQIGNAGAPTTATYSTGDIAVPIPDVATINIPINVPDTGLVDDVNVRVRLNHTFDGDLDISLVHPDGTVILLSNNRGGSGQNFGTGTNNCSGTPTVFDDEAAVTIASGTAPFAGSFRPDVALSGLDGKPTNGTWTLRIADTAALDVGTVGCVTLEIRRLRFICCGVAGTPVIEAGPAVLTTESCPPDNNAIDPGERVTVNLELHNAGTGATTDLVATLQTGGGVSSPSEPQSYGALTPTGPGSSATRDFSFTASGTCGGSITATWQLQDGATNLGTVTKTFVLGTSMTSTTTFANPAPIIIPAGAPATTSGPAAPYPSTINVGGVVNTVTKVTVTLKNMNHTFPDDIDVLLVGPGGQKLLLMSDAGGSADLVNNTYTFDDAAASTLADGALSASGTYKPSNFGTGDTFPAPAPVGPYPDPQLLSVFNGVNPNGTWSLYVFDDVGGDVGNINLGWELNITTSEPICTNPCGVVRLVTSSTLVRTSPSNVQANVTVTNTGTLSAVNVMLTAATLGGTSGTPLPQSLGTINPGSSVNTTVNFATMSTGPSTLTLGGTYTGGTFSTTKRVTIPASAPAGPKGID